MNSQGFRQKSGIFKPPEPAEQIVATLGSAEACVSAALRAARTPSRRAVAVMAMKMARTVASRSVGYPSN